MTVNKSHLITCSTPGLETLCVMSAAVEESIFPEVDEVYEELVTDVTSKAGGVPTASWACTGSTHNDVSTGHTFSTL